MAGLACDTQERLALCELLEELGPDVPTLVEGWTAKDLAAHLVVRERDLLAGPCLVMPGPFQRFAEGRRTRLAADRELRWLVERIRSGPPPGFFRIPWVRSLANLNEFYVHHEDLRRANGLGVRDLLPTGLEAALWRNVGRSSRYLSRKVRAVGLEIVWAGTDERLAVRECETMVRIAGPPGELLLYLFGRRDAARVELTGPAHAVATLHRCHVGM